MHFRSRLIKTDWKAKDELLNKSSFVIQILRGAFLSF